MKQKVRQTFDLTIYSHVHVKEGETVIHVQHNKRDLNADSLVQAFCEFLSEYSPVSCEAIDSKQLNVADTGDHHHHTCEIDGERCTSTDCLECARNTTGSPVSKDSTASADDQKVPETENNKRPIIDRLNSAKNRLENVLREIEKIAKELNLSPVEEAEIQFDFLLAQISMQQLAKCLTRRVKEVSDAHED